MKNVNDFSYVSMSYTKFDRQRNELAQKKYGLQINIFNTFIFATENCILL